MNYLIYIFCLIYFNTAFANESILTEITADDGIEVFQVDKYYLLKKNVKINSNNFNLIGDYVKVFFRDDLYDIIKIDASGNVKLNSIQQNINTISENLSLDIDTEEILLSGIKSKLKSKNIKMLSDGFIKLNNKSGNFHLNGANSKLQSDEISINSTDIIGTFIENNEINEIKYIETNNEDIGLILTNDTELYSKKAIYKKETSIIELIENVKIIKGSETILGDYGELDTLNSSYKIRSNSESKVKIVITNQNE